LHAGWNFFGEKFEKKVGHGALARISGRCRSFRNSRRGTSKITRAFFAFSAMKRGKVGLAGGPPLVIVRARFQ
jgi:hypothetical protein